MWQKKSQTCRQNVTCRIEIHNFEFRNSKQVDFNEIQEKSETRDKKSRVWI